MELLQNFEGLSGGRFEGHILCSCRPGGHKCSGQWFVGAIHESPADTVQSRIRRAVRERPLLCWTRFTRSGRLPFGSRPPVDRIHIIYSRQPQRLLLRRQMRCSSAARIRLLKFLYMQKELSQEWLLFFLSSFPTTHLLLHLGCAARQGIFPGTHLSYTSRRDFPFQSYQSF